MTEHGCKVCRVLADRELEHLNAELVARWHGEDGERMGYRRLADWLNTAMLRGEMELVGMPTEGGEARSRYERLVGDDAVGDGSDDDQAAEIRGLLARGGVAVDDLLHDFVSYSVVRTHLTECLDEEREPEPAADWEADRLDQLEAYAKEEAEAAIGSLVNKGEIVVGGAASAAVTIEVSCAGCGASVPYVEAIESETFCHCTD